MGSYTEIKTTFQPSSTSFQRNGRFPLDRSEMFSSLNDAMLYAQGTLRNHDERGLYKTSYVGQTITVYASGVVTDYKVVEDPEDTTKRTLVELVPIGEIQRNSETIEPVEGVVNIDVPEYSGGTGVQITGGTINVNFIDCGDF